MFEKTFTEPDTFAAYYAAEKWCADRGYSVGSMQGDNPIGIVRGDCIIHKWDNCTRNEQRGFDGTIESLNFRAGPVIVKLRRVGSEPAVIIGGAK